MSRILAAATDSDSEYSEEEIEISKNESAPKPTQSSTNLAPTVSPATKMPQSSAEKINNQVQNASEGKSDYDYSTDDDEIATTVESKNMTPSSSKIISQKLAKVSDSEDESDSTGCDETESENDASDEEEEEEEETEVKSNPPSSQVTVTPKPPIFKNINADEDTEEDYTSSEDEVFVKKPSATKPIFDVDSDSSEPDYSDDSSEDEIPLKNIPTQKSEAQQNEVAKTPTKISNPFRNPFTPTAPTVTAPPPEDTFLLNALHEFKLNLNDPITRQKELERRAEEALRRNELTFVCCVCFENYYRSDNFGKCKKLNNKKAKVDHYICVTCLRGTATPENAGICPDGSGLKCPFPECPNILLMSEIHGMIDEGIESNLLELIGRMSLASSNIGFLVTCPKCQKQWIMENKEEQYYLCECQRKNCMFCEREYDEIHEGKSCVEVAAFDKKTKKQNEIALEMNNVIVRVCHKCGLQFLKSDGCNKMTCRCKATQCYLCRAKDIDYGHFGGACQLFDNADAFDQLRLDEVTARNQ